MGCLANADFLEDQRLKMENLLPFSQRNLQTEGDHLCDAIQSKHALQFFWEIWTLDTKELQLIDQRFAVQVSPDCATVGAIQKRTCLKSLQSGNWMNIRTCLHCRVVLTWLSNFCFPWGACFHDYQLLKSCIRLWFICTKIPESRDFQFHEKVPGPSISW